MASWKILKPTQRPTAYLLFALTPLGNHFNDLDADAAFPLRGRPANEGLKFSKALAAPCSRPRIYRRGRRIAERVVGKTPTAQLSPEAARIKSFTLESPGVSSRSHFAVVIWSRDHRAMQHEPCNRTPELRIRRRAPSRRQPRDGVGRRAQRSRFAASKAGLLRFVALAFLAGPE